jgi:hypothetical protein
MLRIKKSKSFGLTCICVFGLFACGEGREAPVTKATPEKKVEMTFVVPTPSADTLKVEKQIQEMLAASQLTEATDLYIDACMKAPKKGYAPSVEFKSSFPQQAEKQLIAAYEASSKDEIDHARQRCIVAALARHPKPSTLQNFWRKQLETNDQQLRWWAVLELSKIADVKDLPLVLAQAIEVPDLGALLSKRLVQWKDPKVVPFLYDLAKNSDPFSSKRAKRSLEKLGYSDVLSDKEKYNKEFAWWDELNKQHTLIRDIVRPWRSDARSVPK